MLPTRIKGGEHRYKPWDLRSTLQIIDHLVVGMLLVIGVDIVLDVVHKLGDIGNTVVDLGLFAVLLHQHGHVAAAQIQIEFRNLAVFKVSQHSGVLDQLLVGRLGKQGRCHQQKRQQKRQINAKSLG